MSSIGVQTGDECHFSLERRSRAGKRGPAYRHGVQGGIDRHWDIPTDRLLPLRGYRELNEAVNSISICRVPSVGLPPTGQRSRANCLGLFKSKGDRGPILPIKCSAARPIRAAVRSRNGYVQLGVTGCVPECVSATIGVQRRLAPMPKPGAWATCGDCRINAIPGHRGALAAIEWQTAPKHILEKGRLGRRTR